MSFRPFPRVTPAVRAGAAAVALAGSIALAPAASASTTSSLVIGDGSLEYGISAVENHGTGIERLLHHRFDRIAARFGGSVVVTMPSPLVDAGHVRARVGVGNNPVGADAPAVTYVSDATDPGLRVSLTALGGNRYRVGLPADDGVSGPDAELLLTGFDLPGAPPGSVEKTWRGTGIELELSASAPASVDVAPQLDLVDATADPCPPSVSCDPATVAAGSSLTVALGSADFTSLGVPDFGNSSFVLNDPSVPNSVGTVLAAEVAPDMRSAVVTVPTGTAPGPHFLSAYLAGPADSANLWSGGQVTVVAGDARPESVAPGNEHGAGAAVGDAGLSSATQGTERDAGLAGDLSPLLPIGAGLVLAAAAVASIVVVRARRRRGQG